MNKNNMQIIVRKKNEKTAYEDDYVSDPEVSLDILENLRLEAENFLYDKPVTFQRIITIVGKKTALNMFL